MVRTRETVEKWRQKVPKGRCLNDGATHFRKGHVPWNKGQPRSSATKKKISDSKKANPTKYWLGKTRSAETVEAIRESKIGSVPWNKGTKQPQTSGENNPNWKGGTTLANKIARTTAAYAEWRAAVFARDDWTCQKCNVRGVPLHPHHIENFAEKVDKRFVVENGVTFCIGCHGAFHKEYGRTGNSREQIMMFVSCGAGVESQ